VEPNRFPYSPISTRPKLKWPGDARIALWIVPNIEHYEYLPNPVGARDPWPRVPHPDVQAYGARDYGNRVGFWRMLDVIDKYDVPCTVSLNIAAYEHYPEIMAQCEARRWDVMCHGIYNTQYLWNLPEDEERALIADCVSSFRRQTGRDFTGWFSPAGTHTLNTPDLVAEAGIRYYCDWFHDDQPFPMRVKSGNLITMPYQMDVNDGLNFRVNIDAEEFADNCIALFDQLYAESEENGRIMTFAPHPYILGHPHRIRHFERILKHILSHDGVWKTTGIEIVDWYTKSYLPQLTAHLEAERSSRLFRRAGVQG
jgi:allantoinase